MENRTVKACVGHLSRGNPDPKHNTDEKPHFGVCRFVEAYTVAGVSECTVK